MTKVNVLRLAHVHYQFPDLVKEKAFLLDFGFVQAHHEDNRIYYKGFGTQPYILIAEQSPYTSRKFIGATWVVKSAADLDAAALLLTASPVQQSTAPGGGQVVSVKDPNGFEVNFIYGQTLREDERRAPASGILNTADRKPRKGAFKRFSPGPSPVHKLGYYGFVIPKDRFHETVDWYTTIMNVTPTDAVFDPATRKDETVFLHIDLGLDWSDHHVGYSFVSF
jgi:hypothetical protein